MGDRPGESVGRDLDALFRLGVLAGMSDGQLLERFATRADEDGQTAFEAIVRRHGSMVLGVCRRVLGHHQAAEDAFQATFLVLALKAGRVRAPQSLGPWLHGVAARIARRARSSERRARLESLPLDLPDASAAADPELADLAAVLDEELSRLPDRYRLPVVMCYLEGQSQEEAARALGWSKGTVSGRLARAKDLLRHRLARRGLAPSAVVVASALASSEAEAAVPASLLVSTVRTSVAAILGGVEAGAAAGRVAALARGALRWLLVTRVARAAALALALTTAAIAVATPVLIPGRVHRAGRRPDRPVGVDEAAAARRDIDRKAPMFDRFGDPLPAGATQRLGTVQRRHTQRVVGLDFATGGRAVTVQEDGLLRLWALDTGRQIRADSLVDDSPGAARTITHVAVSADGRLVAAAGFDRGVSPQGGPRPVWIWEIEPHRLIRRVDVNLLSIDALAFSPDGATLAITGFGGEVRLREVATGADRRSIRTGLRLVTSIAYAPDGRSLVATGQAQGVALCDLQEGQVSLLAGLKGSRSPPRFSPKGAVLAVPEIATGIALWDRNAGKTRGRIPGTVAAFSPDGGSLAVTGSSDGMLAVRDIASGAIRWQVPLELGLSQSGPTYSPDGKTLLIETDGALRFLDAATGSERFGDEQTHQLRMSAIRYAADGSQICALEYGGTVRIWDARTAQARRVLARRGRTQLLAVSPDGRHLAVSQRDIRAEVVLWDLTSGEQRFVWPLPGQSSHARALAFSPDGKSVLVYGDQRILSRFQVGTGNGVLALQPQLKLSESRSPFDAVIVRAAFSPGNRFLAVVENRTVHVADLATGKERYSAACAALAFAPDGKHLALAVPAPPRQARDSQGRVIVTPTLDSGGISLVNVDSGRERRFEMPAALVRALAFSPDGRLLAAAADAGRSVIRLLRIADGRELAELHLPAPVTSAESLAFSPDSRGLAAGLQDTTIPIWDISRFD